MPAKKIMVIGESGSGKSRSVKNLPPEETFLINVVGKDLPFKGSGSKYRERVKDQPKKVGNMLISRNPKTIVKYMKKITQARPHVKYIVIDDFQYMMSLTYVTRVHENSYKKFQDILSGVWDVISSCDELRSDVKVFFLIHSEDLTEFKKKAKTAGKAVDRYLTLEGLFTIVLWTKVIRQSDGEGSGQYYFETQNDGTNTAKSPEEMFDFLIPNDLYYVAQGMDAYYEEE